MYVPSGKLAVAHSSIWNRTRFQLGLGLLFAIVLPYLVRWSITVDPDTTNSLPNSLIGSAVALLLGHFAYSKFANFPGVRASYNIFPAFAASFGLVVAFFFFARLDYSRLHFAVSLLLCIGWYYVVYFKLQRQKRLRIGIVPFGEVDELLAIEDVEWLRLDLDDPSWATVDAIVADLRYDVPDEWDRFIADRALDGMLVLHVKQLHESLTGRVAIEHLSENTLGSLIPGIVYAKVKRLGDGIAAGVALVALLPILLLIVLAIRFDSRGAAVFRQQRMGYRGRPFTMYKFRTMAVPTAESDPRTAAITRDDDERVTRVGRILRRYRFDELPQIFNILKGEMSWIGPRPEAVPLSLWYEAELPFYRYRHIVRPGISGWAQVKQGHVAEVDLVLSKLHYDFYYIKNFSFWLDMLIVAGTIRTVFSGFGSR